MAQRPLQRGAGQVVVPLLHGQFRLPPPLCRLLHVLNPLLIQKMLICNGNGDLGFYLEQLVFHVQDNLFQQPLRIFGLLDQVVEICAEQRAYSLQQCHGVLLVSAFSH